MDKFRHLLLSHTQSLSEGSNILFDGPVIHFANFFQHFGKITTRTTSTSTRYSFQSQAHLAVFAFYVSYYEKAVSLAPQKNGVL